MNEVDGSRSDQFDKALELGCETGIHGEINFTQPLDPAEKGTGVYSLTSPDHALSVADMCDQGYIEEEVCESGQFAP
ncbi:hypothetical protein [Nesterenkonia sphaerica]|uniref:Uncharacterized protein n=1 Tax=Nesterenkonia sphaerica TaxID=1804988 RepID=A0A5R8ZYD5_9MICC|nr:hypothetical protein [Nesterenkonia sphaerica]TLP71270.1 hypothetical protein FEF27_12535 [Nesterenkonia sphaerica]